MGPAPHGGPPPTSQNETKQVSRRSSLTGGRSSSLAMSRADDPRKIDSKDFMKNSIPQLINYLVTHSFDHSINPKILTRPSVKDFNNIVLFLFKQIDPNFTCTGKFEDEVISMFKQLKYPYPISKTNLVAAGSPTAWPQLLAAIMWLIELLNYDEAAKIGIYNPDDLEDDPSGAKAFFSYLSKAYSCFLNGDDETYALLEEQFVESYESINKNIARQVEQIEDSNAALEKSVRELETRTEKLSEVRKYKEDMNSDADKFKQLIETLENKRQHHQDSIVRRTEELKSLNESNRQTEENIKVLKEKIACQELQPEDVKRMNEKRTKMEEALDGETTRKEELENKVWELEKTLRDKVQSLDECARKYNQMGEELRLVPHTAKNARGHHLEVEVDIRAKKKSGVLKSDIEANILPVLSQLKDELSESSKGYRDDLVALQDELDEIEEQISTKEHDLTDAENKLKKEEDLYRHEKETFDQAQANHEEEMRDIETRLMQKRDKSVYEARIAAAERKIAEINAIKESREQAHLKMKRELMEAVMEAVTQCAAHREFVQEQLQGTKSQFQARLESFMLKAGMGSGIKSTTMKYSQSQRKKVMDGDAVNADQIHLEEDGDNLFEESYDDHIRHVPSMGGMSPINNAKENFNANDMDNSAISMVPGLNMVNLSMVAKEQSIRNRLSSLPGRTSEVALKANLSNRFDETVSSAL